jgi:Sulfotransferase domain
MSESKLHFVIGGAQKSGTTTLDGIFRYHPQIQMASTKETHFFDNEKLDWLQPDYSALEAYFPEQDKRLRGESTPITLYWRPAIRRLYAYNPQVKIVLLLRNPITRCFSNWRKEFSRRFDKLPFSEAIRSGRARVRNEAVTEDLHVEYSYVERSFYGQQLLYLLSYFPKENIHCEIFEEMAYDREPILQRISNFLEIDPFPENIPIMHLNPHRIVSYPSILTEDDAAYLLKLFRHEIEVVESILSKSLLSWYDLASILRETA